jgi:hypothetical protein
VATPTSAASSRARRLRRPVVAATAILLSALLAGCSNGFGAQTDEIYQPGPGVTVREDGVYLLNASIVTDGSGNGTIVGALLDEAGTGDQLVSIALKGKLTNHGTIIGGSLDLPPHRSVQLAERGNIRISGTLTPGTYQFVTLTFRNGAPIAVGLPVLRKAGDFADVPVGPVPGAVGRSPSQ